MSKSLHRKFSLDAKKSLGVNGLSSLARYHGPRIDEFALKTASPKDDTRPDPLVVYDYLQENSEEIIADLANIKAIEDQSDKEAA